MSTFERVVDGKVVERVNTVPNSHEDNRLGLAAIEGKGDWRVAETPDAVDKAAASTTAGDENRTDGPKPKAPKED